MIYDIIGIGFGPSNLALAISLKESNSSKTVRFFEAQSECYWHTDMLLDGSDIQNNPLRDLITPVNPSSNYTFIQYLHKHKRFFDYLNLGLSYPLRKDFYAYIQWASSFFSDVVQYNTAIVSLEFLYENSGYVWKLTDNFGEIYFCKNLVLATGRKHNIPPEFENIVNAAHLTRYKSSISALSLESPIVVIGASQSAVEILLDLHQRGFQKIYSIHRSHSYRLKDTSPFSDEVYFPEFVDYYHDLSSQSRIALDTQLRATNYSSADADVLHLLYLKIYEDKLDGLQRIKIYRNHQIKQVNNNPAVSIDVYDIYTKTTSTLPCEHIILATGFLDIGRNGASGLTDLLIHHKDKFSWHEGYLTVNRDYSIQYHPSFSDYPPLYLNGLCESSHGLGDAGSFSLVSFRARDINNSLHHVERLI